MQHVRMCNTWTIYAICMQTMHTWCPCCCISLSRVLTCCCRVPCCCADQAKDLPLSRIAQSSDVPTGVLADFCSPGSLCRPCQTLLKTKDRPFQHSRVVVHVVFAYKLPMHLRGAPVEASLQQLCVARSGGIPLPLQAALKQA